jgi:hypothetical protein
MKTGRGYLRSFLVKLSAALPASLGVFWLVLNGDTLAILAYGATSALLGTVLLILLETHSSGWNGLPGRR